jgi:hypothetical protein
VLICFMLDFIDTKMNCIEIKLSKCRLRCNLHLLCHSVTVHQLVTMVRENVDESAEEIIKAYITDS